MDAILPQLTATLEVDTEEGYTGVLTLDTASIRVEAAAIPLQHAPSLPHEPIPICRRGCVSDPQKH